MLVMLAFVWCYKIGDYINQMIKPIKIKTHGRRQVSIFKCGLVYLSECLLSRYNKLNIILMQFLVVCLVNNVKTGGQYLAGND